MEFTLDVNLRSSPEPHKGKTIRIIVGSTTGGFYDRWARLFSRYMGKYIPGNPEIIAQNMPAAGSLVATNYVYNVAKPDGLTLGMPLSSIYLEQLAARKEVQFDLRNFHWIGSPAREATISHANTHLIRYGRYYKGHGATHAARPALPAKLHVSKMLEHAGRKI
jgi:tripartite-type tricarboxylate transporter receptor subunit TctC